MRRILFVTLTVIAVISSGAADAAQRTPPRVQQVRNIDPRQLTGFPQQGTVGFSSAPRQITAVGRLAFFMVNDPTGRFSPMWRSDGTYAGTVLVKDFAADPTFRGDSAASPVNLTALGSALFFGLDDGVNGLELWRSDGTSTGTAMFLDLNPGPEGSQGNSGSDLFAVGNTLFFAANDGVNGFELWKTDGTPAGTTMIKDINPGPGGSSPQHWAALGGVVYFAADDGVNGFELWRTDGTSAGTSLVVNLGAEAANGYPDRLTVAGGRLFFTAKPDDAAKGEPVGSNAGLWVSDGTTAGTTMLRPGLGFDNPAVVGSRLFIGAYDSELGNELVVSDGTLAGTRFVDLNPGPDSTSLFRMTTFGGVVLFQNWDAAHGAELWRSDGTVEGTRLVRDIFLGEFGSFPVFITVVGGRAFFSAYGGFYGTELWYTDGTAEGTNMAFDINVGSGSSGPSELTAVGGMLLFSAMDRTYDVELWKATP